VTKSHGSNYRRGHKAYRLLPIAFSVGAVVVDCHFARADSTFNATGGVGDWNTATAWVPNGVPGNGSVADIFKASGVCFFNLPSTASTDLSAVQIADSATLSFTAALSSNSSLDTTSFEIGGTNTGQAGRVAATGGGFVSQSAGFVTIDPLGVLAVDSASSYTMSGTAPTLTALAGANETLAGTFTQSGGTNKIYTSGELQNSGTYLLETSSAAVLSCDTYINSGTFNQSSGMLEAYTNGLTGSFNFNNSGSFLYSGGSFGGVMNNTGSVQVNGAAIPFADGIVNTGLLTLNASTGSFAGVISGNSSNASLVVKEGSTNVTLTGSNNYLGSTTISTGTLILGSPAGVAPNFGSALQGNVSIGAMGTLLLAGSDQIANNVLLTINGGTFNLAGFNESVGSLTMDAGTIQQSSSGVGLAVASGLITVGTGSAIINGGLRSASPLTFNISTGNSASVYGPMGSYNAAGQALVLNGGGTLYFSGASNLSSITVNNGILQVAEGGTLGGVNASLVIQSGGSLSLNNQTLTVGDLTGSSNSAISLGTGVLTVSSIVGSSYPGTISGAGSFIKSGAGSLSLTGTDLSTGGISVAQGTLTLAPSALISASSLSTSAQATLNISTALVSVPDLSSAGTINIMPLAGSGIQNRTFGSVTLGTSQSTGNGQINVSLASPHTNRTLLIVSGVTFGGTTGAWAGQIDLSNNDMIVHNGSLPMLTSLVASGYNGSSASWNGQGITSSAAAADTTHLTALGVILNDNGNGIPIYNLSSNLGLFDKTYNPSATDVLIKYTYYGDANLDGQVDGSDYSLIDNGYLRQLTGWYNGDFNYDGVINGSDYTLIDNAYNTQGANLTSNAEIANTTAQIANVSSVPEPATLASMGIGMVCFLSRRRFRSR
jgi:autotransporter-associated beta strand protein